MPYEGEFAQYKSLRRVAESERVLSLLGRFKVRAESDQLDPIQTISMAELGSTGWSPDYVLAIDSSHAEVPIKNGFPGAEASYVTVSSVLINMALTKELDQYRPVDPKEFRRIEQAESIDCALPGCNVIIEEEQSAQDSLRRTLNEVLQSVFMSSDGENLLDTYEALLQHKPSDERGQKCHYEDCPVDGLFLRGQGKYVCNCPAERALYSTDALRIHERMDPVGSNGAIFDEVSRVLETLWLIHILRTLEAQKWLTSLRRLAIVMDGPLAVFGQPAWISPAMYQELSRINSVARKATGGQDILIIGVEKTGNFVDHFVLLDQHENGVPGRFPSSSIMLLTDSYIKRNIVFSTSTRPYGRQTYYGRKFFFKSSSNALIVAALPFLEERHRDLDNADVSQFPRLSDAVFLLDQLISSRYPNAVTPVVAAHAEAAIPLRLGKKVLEQLAKELTLQD